MINLKEYQNALTEILTVDDRIVGKYKLLAYLPDLMFEATTKIYEKNVLVDEVAESFDVFKVLELKTGKEVYMYYGDFDSIGWCNLKTLMKKCKTCIVKRGV